MDQVRSLEVANQDVHGRSVVHAITLLAHLWGLFSANLAPLLPTNVVSAIETLVAAVNAFKALNPPGPQ